VSLCLETRRPQPYPSVSQVISRLLTCIETLPPSSLSRQSAHRRLRSIVANPRVLAYRAGPQVHWDEARRRVLVSYVQVRLLTRRRVGCVELMRHHVYGTTISKFYIGSDIRVDFKEAKCLLTL
jgi:hypothetical protein